MRISSRALTRPGRGLARISLTWFIRSMPIAKYVSITAGISGEFSGV